MSYSNDNNIFASLLYDEKELSLKYISLLSSSANAEIQSKLQFIQRSNNESVAMLLTEADSRGYKFNG